MKKVKCENGHFFDVDRFASCPVCGAAPKEEKKPETVAHSVERSQKTASKTQTGLKEGAHSINWFTRKTHTETASISEEPATDPVLTQITKEEPKEELKEIPEPEIPQPEPESLFQAVSDTGSKKISSLPKTMSLYGTDDLNPPVGWLVGIKGKYLGASFNLIAGVNRIGRNPNMEICLIDDPTVSRDANSLLIFEPIKREFYIQAGASGGLTYLNGNLVFSNSHELLKSYDRIMFGKSEFVFIPLCGEKFTWDDFIS